jgi:hypothetical protein
VFEALLGGMSGIDRFLGEVLDGGLDPLASATADKMDVLRETVTARSADLDETVRARLDALPERGIDNPSQGVDPVLASRRSSLAWQPQCLLPPAQRFPYQQHPQSPFA